MDSVHSFDPLSLLLLSYLLGAVLCGVWSLVADATRFVPRRALGKRAG